MIIEIDTGVEFSISLFAENINLSENLIKTVKFS